MFSGKHGLPEGLDRRISRPSEEECLTDYAVFLAGKIGLMGRGGIDPRLNQVKTLGPLDKIGKVYYRDSILWSGGARCRASKGHPKLKPALFREPFHDS